MFFTNNRHEYVTAFFIGGGLSGLIPGILAIAQGTYEVECVNKSTINNTTDEIEWNMEPELHKPRFSVEVYLSCLLLLLLSSSISFLLLNVLPVCKREHTPTAVTEGEENQGYEEEEDYLSHYTAQRIDMTNRYSANVPMTNGLAVRPKQEMQDLNSSGHQNRSGSKHKLSTFQFVWFYSIQLLVCAFMMGIVPAISSFSSLPYGYSTYHLSLILSNIANPLVCFIPFLVVATGIVSLTSFTALGIASSCYLLVLAIMNPNPFIDSSGGAICVVAFIIEIGTFAYVNVCLASVFRSHSQRALFWCGVATQAGSFIGAVVIFISINISVVFVESNPC